MVFFFFLNLEWYWLMAFGLGIILLQLLLLKIYIKCTTGLNKDPNRLDGKTVIVTGANNGIGYETAKDFAHRGARVILACRDYSKGAAARDKIEKETRNPNVVLRKVDFACLSSVRAFATDILATEERIHILVNNAGAAGLKNSKTEDGLQILMQVNHFAPFLLTNLLLDRIKESAPSKVIVVSSVMHKCAKLNLHDINMEKNYKSSKLYSNTKLCNIAFANELARRVKQFGVTVNSVHPGVISTGIWKNMPVFLSPVKLFIYLLCKSPWEGAQTTIYLAVSPKVENVTGKYFADCKETSPSRLAQDPTFAERLWNASLQCVGMDP